MARIGSILVILSLVIGIFATIGNSRVESSIQNAKSDTSGSHLNAYEKIYEEDFTNGARGWHYYPKTPSNQVLGCIVSVPDGCVIPNQWAEGHIESRSPWWIDPNHASPGAGYLNIVGVAWLDSYYGGLPQQSLDLTNTEIQIELTTEELSLGGGHLYFWFQMYDAATAKFVNFALTQYPIDTLITSPGWNSVTLKLPPSNAAWTCLGAAVERQDRYGCIPIEEALRNVNADLGFIILPVNPDQPTSGTILFDRILIDKGSFLFLPLVQK